MAPPVEDYFFLRPETLSDGTYCGPGECVIARDSLARYILQEAYNYVPLLFCLGGPTVTGKSSLAVELGRILGIRTIISTDTLRHTLSDCCPTAPPELSLFSHQCWQVSAEEYSPQALIEGFVSQSHALLPALNSVARHCVVHKQNCILEGVHLIPEIVAELEKEVGLNLVPLFLVTSEAMLLSTLLPRRTVSTYRHKPVNQYSAERLSRFRVLSRWWDDELRAHHLAAIVNDGSPEDLLASASHIISQHLERLLANSCDSDHE